MKNIFACLLVTFVLTGPFAFSQSASQPKNSAYCWSVKGINIREKPSGKSAALGKIPYKGKVTILDTVLDAPHTDTLNQSIPVRGHWMKIQQGNVIGYAFNGYLSLIEPQTFYQYFDGITPVKEVLPDGAERNTYTRKDQSQYSYVVSDGCWTHAYFLKGATLNDGLMLVSTTEPHEAEDCPFVLTKTEGNKYFLADCSATQNRMIEVLKDGVIYHTDDCD